jgi:cytochrome c oxidase assembly protein Cox11
MVMVFGISYLMVPLYRIFCAMTGVTGDVQVKNQTLLDEIEAKRSQGTQYCCSRGPPFAINRHFF